MNIFQKRVSEKSLQTSVNNGGIQIRKMICYIKVGNALHVCHNLFCSNLSYFLGTYRYLSANAWLFITVCCSLPTRSNWTQFSTKQGVYRHLTEGEQLSSHLSSDSFITLSLFLWVSCLFYSACNQELITAELISTVSSCLWNHSLSSLCLHVC